MIRILPLAQATTLLSQRRESLEEAEAAVRPIIDAVRYRGDDALLEYARKFDGLASSTLRIAESELASAEASLTPALRSAASTAIANIGQFSKAQMPLEWKRDFGKGRQLGQIVRPLNAVGCYVPSGRYPLPSTLLMSAVPALTAGVKRIAVTSPKPTAEILGCARMLGLIDVYRVGGAHAIAALAYGTETIQRVDRIVGPGNIYVTAAKKLLSGTVGIDFIAGPTEILILSSDGDASIIAADMLAQAEHDTAAAAILVTTSRALGEQVAAELELQLATLPTATIAREAIERNSAILMASSVSEGIDFVNDFAPEHLSLHDGSLLKDIRNAGTVFLGQYSPESAGDYAAGPSHVLPTSGVARLRAGLSVNDFVKVITVQELSVESLHELAPAITTLARAEGLEAHARAVEVRTAR